MQGLKVGHYTNPILKTGASVFLFDQPAIGAYHLCGASPATHEINTLELDSNTTHANALTLLGGSAFGLNAVSGVMQWLKEQNQGWPAPHGRVPIVPAAAIYDLEVGDACAPSAADLYQACKEARETHAGSPNVGAGTGASVGKLVHLAARMSGGIGHAEMVFADNIQVEVYAVVNSVGDIRDGYGNIIAGAHHPDGSFANSEKFLLAGNDERKLIAPNTTLIAIFTNAAFSRIELKRIAKMAVAGMARAISPIFTRYDGDIIFCFSLGNKVASELVVGAAAVEITRLAILDAVRESISL